MENNNKLDILTKKIFEEGIEKAEKESENIIAEAKKKAAAIVDQANHEAAEISAKTADEIDKLRKQSSAEMAMSVRQSITSLKQTITNLITASVTGEMTATAFNDKDFVKQMMMTVLSKWNLDGDNSINVLLNDKDKADFEAYIAAKDRKLLDNLAVKTDKDVENGFVISPKDNSYKIEFTEEAFQRFFSEYVREYSKKLLFEQN